jgi:hypothetical protein
MRQIQLTPISGNFGRPSLFGYSVEQSRSFHPTLSGSFRLGQTPTDWYRRAKESLVKFDSLISRMNRIANQTERKVVQDWVGSPSTEGTPAYRRRSVESDLTQDVEAYTPPNVNAYQVERRTNRIAKLEDINADFESRVANAEVVYGILPPDQVITQERLVTQTQTPGWVLPVAIGAGTLGIAALVTILSGGKK